LDRTGSDRPPRPLSARGAVHVYRRERPGTPWIPFGLILNPAPSELGSFGESIDFDGARLVVGTSGRDGYGAADLYTVVNEPTPAITFETTFAPSIGWISANFGRAVAIEGDIVVVADRCASPPGVSGAAVVGPRLGASTIIEAVLASPSGQAGTAWPRLAPLGAAWRKHRGSSETAAHRGGAGPMRSISRR
jgi:hypothetical protein